MALPTIVPTGFAGDYTDFLKVKTDRGGDVRRRDVRALVDAVHEHGDLLGVDLIRVVHERQFVPRVRRDGLRHRDLGLQGLTGFLVDEVDSVRIVWIRSKAISF